MKRLFWLIPAVVMVLVFCAPAGAQDTPAWELSGGYSYLRANLNGSSFGLNGLTTSLTENVNSWFGGRIEANAYQGTAFGANLSAQTFTFGPVFSYRHYDKMTPFAHVQLGAIHANQGYLGISQTAFKFAVTSGGGVDLNINQRVAVRVQADYLLTNFLALRQDNVQGSVALIIRFGTK